MEKHSRQVLSLLAFVLTVYCVEATTIDQFFDSAALQTRLFDAAQSADLSITFLRVLFGNVSSLGGTNVLTGEIFKMFNYGVFAVVSVTIAYTIITSVIGSSQDGSGAFSNRVSPWVLFRTVGGVSIMVPMDTGYSVIQTLVMKIVLLGVSMANTLWNGALIYHQSQGGIYLQQESTSEASDTSISNRVASTANYLSELYERMWDSYDTLCEDDTRCRVNVSVAIISNSKNLKYILTKQTGQEECFTMSALLPSMLDSEDADSARVQTAMLQARLLMSSPTRLFLRLMERHYEEPLFLESVTSQSPGAASQPALTRWQRCYNGWVTGASLEESQEVEATRRIEQLAGTVSASAVYYVTTMEAAASSFSASGSGSSEDWHMTAASSGWLASGMYYSEFLNPTSSETPSTANVTINYSNSSYSSNKHIRLSPTSSSQSGTTSLLARTILAIDNMQSTAASVPTVSSSTSQGSLSSFTTMFSTMLDQPSPLSTDEDPRTIDDDIASKIAALGSYVPGPGETGTDAAYSLIPNLSGTDDTTSTGWIYGIDVAKPISTLAIMLKEVLLQLLGINEAGGDNCPVRNNNTYRAPSYYMSRESCLHRGSLLHTIMFPNVNVNAIKVVQNLGKKMVDASVRYYVDTIEGLFDQVKALADYHFAITTSVNVASASAEAATYGMPAGAFIGAAASALAEITNTGLKMGYNGVKVALDMYVPLGTAVAAMLFTMGIILGVYIPMLPFLLFLFGMVAWLMSVIEAMVAAPLVALGVTHPEGHDLLGKAEQALMLLLGVFIRPSMMLFGMIMSIIVSQLLLKLFHLGFLQILVSFFSSTEGSIEEISIILLGSLLIYVYVLINVIEQSFSLVYVIPERVLRWVGGPQDQTGVGQLADQTKGEVQQASGQAAQGASQSTSAPNLSPSTANMDAPEKDDAEEKGDKEKGAGGKDGGKGSAGGGGGGGSKSSSGGGNGGKK